jgi:protein-S-isoprenylcysteine O-methyltransferase Ste14
MSIVALMQDEALADSGGAVKRGRKAAFAAKGDRRAAAPDPPASQLAAAATELARYIPTEAIGLYTAILPFLVTDGTPLSEQNYTGRWILAGGVTVAAVLFAVGVYRKEVLQRKGDFKWPIKRTLTVIFAFAAWVMVIPGSPFQDFSWYTSAIGGIVGLVAVAALALFNLWFGEVES